MPALSPSPLVIAMVQAATSLPAFLLALPAGALADITDRRRLLLITQSWIVVLSSVNVAVRMVVPAWIQARSLAFYLLVFQAGTTVGSLIWGALAGRLGVHSTLVVSGIGIEIAIAIENQDVKADTDGDTDGDSDSDPDRTG